MVETIAPLLRPAFPSGIQTLKKLLKKSVREEWESSERETP